MPNRRKRTNSDLAGLAVSGEPEDPERRSKFAVVSSTPSDPRPSGRTDESAFEAEDELRYANEIFGKGERFGEIEGARIAPFSRQLKKDIELHFSIDTAIFEETNRIQTGIFSMYIALRLSTFVLFLAWLYVVGASIAAARGIEVHPMWLMHTIQSFGPIVTSVGSLMLLGVARLLLRRIYFWVVGLQVDTWASHVIKCHGDIVNRIQTCCNRILMRPKDAREYPDLAKNWAKVALFNAKRVEYLDRHSTTAMWKINRNLFWIEQTFRIMNIVAVLTLLTFIWSPTLHNSLPHAWGLRVPPLLPAQFPNFDLGLTALVLVGGYIVWELVDRKRNDLWGRKFVERFNEAHVPREHYFEQIGNTVLAIVSQLIARDLNHL